MGFRCAHFADIHFRGLSRHDEYKKVFSSSFEKLRELKPDVIFLGGDIVHTKTQGISPELIDILSWWLNSMSKIAPVHLILGNHDGLISNEDRLDAITPIVNALGNPRIKLMKGTGVYQTGVEGFNWCVFCCFDSKNWSNLKPADSGVNIALYHGPVNGSLTDQDCEMHGDIVKVDMFRDYDYVMLGDIHKRQFLSPKIAYPGSTIQQNYAEEIDKGFLFWDIEDKENFNVEFIQLTNRHTFRTIKWEGTVEDTISKIDSSWVGSRFRVLHKEINQLEFKQLQTELKEKFDAHEVVSKNEADTKAGLDIEIKTNIGNISRNDLRNFEHQDALMSEFVSKQELTKEKRDALRKLHKDVFYKCVSDSRPAVHQWRLRRLTFDNTFGYGENNHINFDSLGGITGIFGKNRVGKSSIPGTIAYALFNASDRGAIKNVDIINNRKNYCKVAVDFSIAGDMYRAERFTIKKFNHKGEVSAPTSLNLLRIDDDGNQLADVSGEQRRETEFTLRDMVGTIDDFMMTSFAAQGSMNAFINEGATKRKAILSRFLDLQIFDDMLKIAKNEVAELRGEMKSSPSKNWKELIVDEVILKKQLIANRKKTEEELESCKKSRDNLKLQLAALPSDNVYTKEQIENQVSLLNKYKNEELLTKSKISSTLEEIDANNKRIDKINVIKEQFSFESLKEELELQKKLQVDYNLVESKFELENQKLENKKKLAKKLEKVPCGDQFPTCPYIKDAHKSASEIDDQKQVLSEVRKDLKNLRESIDSLLEKKLNEKIQKYENILKTNQSLQLKNSELRVDLKGLENSHHRLEELIAKNATLLQEMRLRSIDDERDKAIVSLMQELKKVETRISTLDVERMNLVERISLSKQKEDSLRNEQRKFDIIKTKWEIYNIFLQAVDKKGIPLTILTLQLPKINKNLQKILQDVVNFNLTLEADLDSNDMDIFIDYGDSKRIIECGSGMEKMIASLALRVALINICNVPRSDTLIIDEGFGALDEKSVEACSRLLISLKKYFTNILIISHVDAIKDVVDNVIDIEKIGKDSNVRYN